MVTCTCVCVCGISVVTSPFPATVLVRSQRNGLGGGSPCHLRSHATATKASFTLGTARRKERTNMGAPGSPHLLG